MEINNRMSSIGKRGGISLLLIYYIIFSLFFVFKVPPFEAPDEPFHLNYANFVAQNSALPNQYDPKRRVYGEGHQHPLYYIIAGIVIRVFDSNNKVEIFPQKNKKHVWNGGKFCFVPYFKHINKNIFPTGNDAFTFYFLRIFSVFFGLINLLYLSNLVKMLISDSLLRWFSLLFVVTLPQLIFNNSYISNDSLSNLFIIMCIFYIFRILKTPGNIKSYILLGISLGFGFLTKKIVLFLFPVLLVVFVTNILKKENRDIRKKILKYSLILLFIFILISGFLLFRNYLVYGELLGNQMEKITLGNIGLVHEKSLLSDYFAKEFFPTLFKSFIAVFGWMNLYMPAYVYTIYLIFFIFCLFGIFYDICRKKEYLKDINIILLFIMILSCLSGIIVYNLTYNQPQGRFLFPVVGLIAVLVVKGIDSVLSRIIPKLVNWILYTLIIVLLLFIDSLVIKRVIDFYYNTNNYH